MNINTLDLTADEAKAILADGSLIMASREEVEQGEAAISERDILRSKVAALEAALAEARKDGERLDALEALAGDNKGGGLLLHHQIGGHVKWSGVGVGLSHRSLRKAIDDFRGAK